MPQVSQAVQLVKHDVRLHFEYVLTGASHKLHEVTLKKLVEVAINALYVRVDKVALIRGHLLIAVKPRTLSNRPMNVLLTAVVYLHDICQGLAKFEYCFAAFDWSLLNLKHDYHVVIIVTRQAQDLTIELLLTHLGQLHHAYG